MYFHYMAGPFALVFITLVLFLLVPWERIQQLFLLGILLGAGFGAINYYVLQNLLGAWRFQNADLVAAAGIPLTLVLAWVPYTITFIHLLEQYRTPLLAILLVLTAAFIPLAYQFLLEINGMIVQRTMAWWGIFLNAAVIHTVQAFIYLTVVLPRKQKITE